MGTPLGPKYIILSSYMDPLVNPKPYTKYIVLSNYMDPLGYLLQKWMPPRKDPEFRLLSASHKKKKKKNFRPTLWDPRGVIWGLYRGYIGIMEKKMETTIVRV